MKTLFSYSAIAATILISFSPQVLQAKISPAPKPAPFNVVEATIPEMQTAMQQGRITSRELVVQCLVRIGLYEDKLHAVITTNPNALA